MKNQEVSDNVLIDLIELATGYRFRKVLGLKQSLTHASFVRSVRQSPNLHSDVNKDELVCNERLEFLGDAVLDLIMSDILFKTFAEDSEGDLSKKRARLVCEESLAEKARKIALQNILKVADHDLRSGLNEKDAVLADALEALIAAVYLDGGYDSCYAFVKQIFADDFASIEMGMFDKDYKTNLQELLQAQFKDVPSYETLGVRGEAHNPEFEVAVCFRGETLAKGIGPSKKKASQTAAKHVWDRLASGSLEIGGATID